MGVAKMGIYVEKGRRRRYEEKRGEQRKNQQLFHHSRAVGRHTHTCPVPDALPIPTCSYQHVQYRYTAHELRGRFSDGDFREDGMRTYAVRVACLLCNGVLTGGRVRGDCGVRRVYVPC